MSFNPEYSDWYTAAQGGRKPMTVYDLRSALAELPGDMPVKVSHQYDRHPVGLQDAITGPRPIAGIYGIGPNGAPIYDMTGEIYFIVE
jgi:hypothetical protein